MAEFRDGVKNTTIKQILNMMDGLGEMVEERAARMEMQMVRSQSSEIGSGFIKDADGVDDLGILLKNVAALKQAVSDGLDAVEVVAKGAKNVHHDFEELAINRYTGATTDDTTT